MSQQLVHYGTVPEVGGDAKLREKSGSSWINKVRNIAANTDNQFIAGGFFFLVLLSLVPIWNACSLLGDPNYVFWEGRQIPFCTIFTFVGIVVLYAATTILFFKRAKEQARTTQSVMMVATIFITLVGLAELAVSLPLNRQIEKTYANILYRCAESEQTHRLYEYSEVLQTIRHKPTCAKKYSVVECDGYAEATPYTNYLKVMEKNLRCSGFCYEALSKNTTTSKKKAAMISVAGQYQTDYEILGNSDLGLAAIETHPPTLFSDLNYKSSCESMVARDLRNHGGDVASQYFWTGLYLIAIVVVAGFLKLGDMCFGKKR